MLTYVLFIIMLYFFTILSFVFLHHEYNGECEQLLECFALLIDWTFKADGGIGGWLSE